MEPIIILTSTVNVDHYKICVYQRDINERINTYLKSILQWIHNTILKLF